MREAMQAAGNPAPVGGAETSSNGVPGGTVVEL
jgi:hypothetical protein